MNRSRRPFTATVMTALCVRQSDDREFGSRGLRIPYPFRNG